jgi:thiamine pyrophosphate-dependent acetolactate synthase large subunit-like protein
VLVTDGKRIPDFIDKVFEIALSGSPGPVHLSISTDRVQVLGSAPDAGFPAQIQLVAAMNPCISSDSGACNG